jgi:hypothetical protein
VGTAGLTRSPKLSLDFSPRFPVSRDRGSASCRASSLLAEVLSVKFKNKKNEEIILFAEKISSKHNIPN